MEIIKKLFDLAVDDYLPTVVLGIFLITACITIWIYQNRIEKLQAQVETLMANKVVLQTAIEQQNEDIAKYKADLKKYNENVINKVSEIKQETKQKVETVKEELKKDDSDTNKVKVIDNLLMDFSDGK